MDTGNVYILALVSNAAIDTGAQDPVFISWVTFVSSSMQLPLLLFLLGALFSFSFPKFLLKKVYPILKTDVTHQM